MRRIYLDHAATTPMLPEVMDAMLPWLRDKYGNPSSLYEEGRKARAAVDEAREVISESIGCDFGEVIFTSSGTEAANLAVLGAALANENSRRNRIVFGAAEHHCVLNTRPILERLGYQVELAPVDREARINLDALEPMLSDDVLLVSVMHANNELGTIQPVQEVSRLTHACGAVFCCDAVQTFPNHELVRSTGADLLFVAAHKINGPKGVGALYIKAGTKIKPLSVGGGQEREMRAGTESVANIVGFAAAVKSRGNSNIRTARDAFVQRLNQSHIPNLIWSVQNFENVLPGHAHLRLIGVSAESMLIKLDRLGVSASSGAACSSGSIEPSHVLLACGYSESEAREGLRFSFGITSTVDEAVVGAEILIAS